jgi:hypothetical protein
MVSLRLGADDDRGGRVGDELRADRELRELGPVVAVAATVEAMPTRVEVVDPRREVADVAHGDVELAGVEPLRRTGWSGQDLLVVDGPKAPRAVAGAQRRRQHVETQRAVGELTAGPATADDLADRHVQGNVVGGERDVVGIGDVRARGGWRSWSTLRFGVTARTFDEWLWKSSAMSGSWQCTA